MTEEIIQELKIALEKVENAQKLLRVEMNLEDAKFERGETKIRVRANLCDDAATDLQFEIDWLKRRIHNYNERLKNDYSRRDHRQVE